jgi:hypothetical protein
MRTIIRNSFLACVLLGLVLVGLGWRLVPTASLVSIAGVCFILVAYGLAGLLGFPRLRPENLQLAGQFGLLAGGIFATEIILEYVLLPRDNSGWGLIEYALVFAVIFGAGVVQAYRSRRIRSGILASVVSGMLASVIWLIFVLLTFYIFRGSARQALVFTAEGNYADFASSGMQDFNAFIIEDFFGGGFFHLVLVPLLAAILGTLAGLVGKGLAHKK